MNTIGNKKNSMIAMIMAIVIVGVAFLGLAVVPGTLAAPGDVDEPVWDMALGATIDSDVAYVYTTNDDQDITLTWDWADPLPAAGNVTDVWVNITDYDTVDDSIYEWNLTTDGGIPDMTAIYNFDGTLAEGSYEFLFIMKFLNTTDDFYTVDFAGAGLEVVLGTPVFGVMSADPVTVDNSGDSSVEITVNINRLIDDIDDDNTSVMIWYEDGMEWATFDEFDPAEENITEDDYTTTASQVIPIPMDTLIGEYKLVFDFFDIWGHNEIYNETIFNVVWNERAPMVSDDTIELVEDFGYAVVDLDDHIYDVNEQDLTYAINLTQFEGMDIDLMWDNESITNLVNISAPENYNGEMDFDVVANDGVENATLTLTIAIAPSEDDLMVAEDTTILVDEVEMWAYFDANALFYDPDGPVNLTVSVDYTESVNETNVTVYEPVWTYEDENISVMINATQQNMSKAMLLQNFEEGRFEFPIAGWVDGMPALRGMAYVEVLPVNDAPMLAMDKIWFYYDEAYSGHLPDLFTDVDSDDLTFMVNTTADNLMIEYNETTMNITIKVANNWTGMDEFEVTVNDGVEDFVITVPVEVMVYMYTITGTVSFEDAAANNITGIPLTLTIGTTVVEINQTTGAYELTLAEGEYGVAVVLTTDMLYDEAAGESGYVTPVIDNMTLDMDKTLDITVDYMVYEEPTVTEDATWDDIDFENAEGPSEDGDIITFAVPVKDAEKTGYGDIDVYLIISDDDDEWEFMMTWVEADMEYTLELDEDQIDELKEGKLSYKFSDKMDNVTDEKEYTFKDEQEDASLVTVIVLIVLIILVLIALVFIMRKPSEEFDEE